MALLGEKCDRCGTRTRHKEDDQPICGPCAQEMNLMVDASEETERLKGGVEAAALKAMSSGFTFPIG